MVVIPQGALRLVDIAVGQGMCGSKARLLGSVVVIKILSAEEPSAWTTVAFGSVVEIVQVGGRLRDAKAAVLALWRQFIESANQPRFLIASDDGGAWKSRYV